MEPTKNLHSRTNIINCLEVTIGINIEIQAEHVLSLAKEIIDDIELSRTNCSTVVKKATRLARFVQREDIREWLRYETSGYSGGGQNILHWVAATNRWSNKEERTYYSMSAAQLEATIEISRQKVESLKMPTSIAGDYALLAIREVTGTINQISAYLAIYESIRTKIFAELHSFAVSVYYERLFTALVENIFDEYKSEIDLLIADNLDDVVEKIPSVIARLKDSDPESITHALTTCRRIIDSFADHIFPAREEPYLLGEQVLLVKQSHVQNRINAFVADNCISKSRRQRIRQNLNNLYERVCASVHTDLVDVWEAKNLFFNVYLLLGEVINLKPKNN